MTPEAKEFHRQWAAAYKAISPDYLSGLEDAANAICEYCRKNETLVQLEGGGWFHRDYDDNLITCEAHAIHALSVGVQNR